MFESEMSDEGREGEVTGYCTICEKPIHGDRDGHIRNEHPEIVEEAKGHHYDDEIEYFWDENIEEVGKDDEGFEEGGGQIKCNKCGETIPEGEVRAHIEERHGQEIEDAVDNHEQDEVRWLAENNITTNTRDENQDQEVALANAIEKNEDTGEPIRVKRIHYVPGTEMVDRTEIKEYADEDEYYEDVPDLGSEPSKDIILSEKNEGRSDKWNWLPVGTDRGGY